jgi:hypothetical protein
VPQKVSCVNTFVLQKRTKIGRPRLPKGEAKSKVVRARVTPSELRAIECAAKASGKDISEWARDVMLMASQA